MKNILLIAKKEIQRVFKDKRLLFSFILPGLLIFLIYTVIGNLSTSFTTNTLSEKATIAIVNEPASFNGVYENNPIFVESGYTNLEIEKINENELEDYKVKITDKEIQLIIYFSQTFDADVSQNQKGLIIFYTNETDGSVMAQTMFNTLINDTYSRLLIGTEDLSGKGSLFQTIGKMLPFFIILFLFTGVITVCPESIAGEKERGSIGMLLISPISRVELAIGKILSLSILSLISSLSSFLGVILSLPKLLSASGMGDITINNMYGFGDYLLILLILISGVFLFVGLCSIISCFAKSVKESTSYISPILILVELIGLVCIFTNMTTDNPVLCIIPLYNMFMTLNSIFSMNINYINVIICIVSNFGYALLFGFLLSKLFQNERVMFNA